MVAITSVEVKTLDDYCKENSVESLNLLKSDTQGYDLEVLKGAQGLLEQNRVQLIFIELNLNDAYKGQPRVDEILGFALDHGFSLVSLYNFHYRDGRASWADALFVNPTFASRKSRGFPSFGEPKDEVLAKMLDISHGDIGGAEARLGRPPRPQ